MDMSGFVKFLQQQGLTPNGINSRIRRIGSIEEILGADMDYVVSNDDRMYDALVKLQDHEDPKHNPMQNVLRKYYTFMRGKEFPRKSSYSRGR